MTDGNLDSHLRRLDGAGYVKRHVNRNGLVRRQRETVYEISDAGRVALDEYLASLERKITEVRSMSA